MSQCITSKNGNTDIPQTTTAIKAATSMAPGSTKRGQSVDDLALTASRPTWRDSLKAKKQKLKQRSLTFDHFYRYVCRFWNLLCYCVYRDYREITNEMFSLTQSKLYISKFLGPIK